MLRCYQTPFYLLHLLQTVETVPFSEACHHSTHLSLNFCEQLQFFKDSTAAHELYSEMYHESTCTRSGTSNHMRRSVTFKVQQLWAIFISCSLPQNLMTTCADPFHDSSESLSNV